MKKTLCLLLALLMTLSLGAFTGVQAESELAPAEVNFWVLGPGEQADTDKVDARLREMIADALPNTTLNMSYIGGGSGAYKEMLNKALAAGERVDLAWGGWVYNKTTLAAEGTVLPLDDLLNAYGQDIIESLGKTCIDLHRQTDGKLYHVVSWQGLMGGRSGLYLPTELVNEMPEGWAEKMQAAYYAVANGDTSDEAYQTLVDTFEVYPKTLQDKGKLYNGIYVDCLTSLKVYDEIDTYALPSTRFAGIVKGEDGSAVAKPMVNENYLRYAKLVSDYYQKGYIQSDIASATQSIQWNGTLTATDYIMNQHAALDEQIDERLSAQYGMPISVIYFNPACKWIKGDDTCVIIPYTCAEPERAMMVLNEFYKNKDLYRTFVYGLEGDHWTDNGDGTITTLGGVGQATADWPYGQWKWTIGTCMNAAVTQGDTVGYYEALKAQEETAYVSPFLTFGFDTSPVATEEANLTAVYEEYHPMFYRGYLNPAEIDAKYEEFTAKLNAAGLEAYMAEYERQVNEYIAANNVQW